MSVEIDWDALTTGPDGLALAESIRDFIHEKFQQVQLPKFIRSVRVHSFEFGDESPSVILKDVCDPLDEFYEDSEEDEDFDDEVAPAASDVPLGTDPEHRHHGLAASSNDAGHLQSSVDTLIMPNMSRPPPTTEESLQERRGVDLPHQLMMSSLSSHDRAALVQQSAPATAIGHPPRSGGLRTLPSFVDQLASPLLSRSTTPGIPGGTANLSYFHHASLPHRQSTFPAPWSDYNFTRPGIGQQQQQQHAVPAMTPLSQPHQSPDLATYSAGDPSTRPSTATTQTPLSRVPTNQSHQQQAELRTQHQPEPWSQQRSQQQRSQQQHSGNTEAKTTPSHARHRRRSSKVQYDPNQPKPAPFSSPPRLPSPSLSGRSSNRRPEPNPQDLQLVLHVRYSGGVRLALSAEILLDYPMSSFVSIPLQLTITGVSFDGVAILAHVRPPLSKQEAGQEPSAEPVGLGAIGDSGSSGAEELTEEQQQAQNRGRAHICFLSPEDARALLGADAKELTSDGEDYLGGDGGIRNAFSSSSPPAIDDDAIAESPPAMIQEQQEQHRYQTAPTRIAGGFEPGSSPPPVHNHKPTNDSHGGGGGGGGGGDSSDEGLGGLLREIRVESEIGQRRDGQQSLRNVGKVEKFVLEQVRRIFEDEFVWPSFWTFLL